MQEPGHGAPSVRIVLWNIAWRRRPSPAGRVIADIIGQHTPDLVCLTEAHTNFLPDGHLIHAGADHGYPRKEGRRKLLLWSRRPWADIDDLGDERLPPGRFVAGVTDTQLGPLRMIGVCVPGQRPTSPQDGRTGVRGRIISPIWKACLTSLPAKTRPGARSCSATSTSSSRAGGHPCVCSRP